MELSLLGMDFLNTCLQFDPCNREWQNAADHDYLQSGDYDLQTGIKNGVDMALSTIEEPHSVFLNNPAGWLQKNSERTFKLNTRNGVHYQNIIVN